MNAARKAELKKIIKANFVLAAEEDIAGRSENLKELWEACIDKKEVEFVTTELKYLIAAVNRMP